jgi:hypothetical protein
MKIQLMLTAAAAVLLGGCTSYTTHGSRTYDAGYYGQGHYRDSGDYDRGGYDGQYHRQAEAQSDTVVVHEHNTTVNQAQVSHAQVSHRTSATVSHGHNGNKVAVGSSTKPAKVPSAGKHPPEKTSKSEKKTEKKTE